MLWDYDPVMNIFLRSSDKKVRKKISDLYEGGKMYDIYVSRKHPEPIVLAIERLTRETYNQIKEEDLEKFHKRRSDIEYYCQYPHQDYKDAIQEYELWSNISQNYDEERIFKTHTLPEFDFGSMREDIKERIKKMKKYQFYPLHMFCFHVTMFHIITTKIKL